MSDQNRNWPTIRKWQQFAIAGFVAGVITVIVVVAIRS